MDKQRLREDILKLENLYIECASRGRDDPDFEKHYQELLDFINGFVYRMSHDKNLEWTAHQKDIHFTLIEKIQQKIPFLDRGLKKQRSLFNEKD